MSHKKLIFKLSYKNYLMHGFIVARFVKNMFHTSQEIKGQILSNIISSQSDIHHALHPIC